MKHLVRSFQTHLGERGVHFYSEKACNFLTWKEVFQVIDVLSSKKDSSFTDRLTETLANYDPDSEFLAVQQSGHSVSVELYSQSR
jgi:hypothetical protein